MPPIASSRVVELVAGGPDGALDVLGQLGTLVEHSLVRPIGEGAEPRFGMLQTIREFAVGRLEDSGEDSATRTRHTAYFDALATEVHRTRRDHAARRTPASDPMNEERSA